MAEKVLERESMTDIAYRLMLKKKKNKAFYDLWEEIKVELQKELTEEEFANVEEDISFFYTNLTLDGRFVQLEGNTWNLRERVKLEDVHIDMNDIYQDDDDEGNEEENEENEEAITTDEFADDAYDDSTGTDADISQYRDEKSVDDEGEDFNN